MDDNYWRGYRHGYRDSQLDEANGEAGMRLDFYRPFIERGVETETANPERYQDGPDGKRCMIYRGKP